MTDTEHSDTRKAWRLVGETITELRVASEELQAMRERLDATDEVIADAWLALDEMRGDLTPPCVVCGEPSNIGDGWPDDEPTLCIACDGSEPHPPER